MLELAVLGSGSKGNSTLIRTPRTALLVDGGLSARQIGLRLGESGADPADLDGVLLTHEHGDHVRGLRVLNKRFPTPVLANAATMDTAAHALGGAPEGRTFITGEPFTWGDFTITSFPVSHDACEPVGYVLEAEGIRVGYATDLGRLTPEIAALIRGCHIVVLEANHDLDMLWQGSYPWATKQRIGGDLGHLDNASGADQVASLTEGDTAHLILVHLSENNNDPGLVGRLFREALLQAGRAKVELTVTGQRQATAPVCL
jgi:phosphoribosyl 1,2-cyclic phosphodiesterase